MSTASTPVYEYTSDVSPDGTVGQVTLVFRSRADALMVQKACCDIFIAAGEARRRKERLAEDTHLG